MSFRSETTLAAAAIIALASHAAIAGTILVDPANPGGWTFSNLDNAPAGTDGSGQFVTGPATPPLGTGSAQLVVGNAQSSEILYKLFSAPTALSGFTVLSYSTYVTTSTAGSGSAPTLQFDLFDGATYEGRLVFDPGLLGTVTDDTWQSWDAATADAWYFTPSSNNMLSSDCSISNSAEYCTLGEAQGFLDSDPGIDAVDVLFKAGDDQSSFDGNVDDFTIGNSDTTTTFNFDPNPVPEPTSIALLAAGLFGFAGVGLRRRRRV